MKMSRGGQKSRFSPRVRGCACSALRTLTCQALSADGGQRPESGHGAFTSTGLKPRSAGCRGQNSGPRKGDALTVTQ